VEANEILQKLEKIISQNGPAMEDFGEFTITVNSIAELIQKNIVTHREMTSLKEKCHFLKDTNSIMGHILSKPFGYAGDFHIIDRIYTQDISEKFPKWDRFSLSNSAAQAVRNRKEYFKEKVAQNLSGGGDLLNIACGPARDLYEFHSENSISNFQTICVEMDERAIVYAKQLNQKFLDKISFVNKNIFQFQTNQKFDLIWSAGLFDYFDEQAFVLLLKRFKNWLKEDGEIIIGNFNENHNPSRAYMELFGEWYLNHRSEEQLYHLAEEAGFQKAKVRVGREPENVNLFLHLKE